MQKMLSYVRRAVDQYHMIEDGDVIAVGVSGGKDSLALLATLSNLRRFYPKKFELKAITLEMGYEEMDFTPVAELCKKLDVEYITRQTDIKTIVFDIRQEENPCSLCAKMRKGALNEAVKRMGCNKVAYAHHKDDLVETMLLSLIFEGRFHSFSPKTYLDRMDLTVIRPLLFVPEDEIIGFRYKYNLPVIKSPCPVDGYTKRQYAKELIRTLDHDHPGTKERMFTAILNGSFVGWPKRTLHPRMKGKHE